MEQIEKIQIMGLSVNLETVSYKLKGDPEELEMEINAEEKHTLKTCDFEHFIILVTRKIKFEPDLYYELIVSASIDFKLSEDTKNKFSAKKDLKAYVEKRMQSYVDRTPIGASLSLLIAQITSTFGKYPVITPPTMAVDE